MCFRRLERVRFVVSVFRRVSRDAPAAQDGRVSEGALSKVLSELSGAVGDGSEAHRLREGLQALQAQVGGGAGDSWFEKGAEKKAKSEYGGMCVLGPTAVTAPFFPLSMVLVRKSRSGSCSKAYRRWNRRVVVCGFLWVGGGSWHGQRALLLLNRHVLLRMVLRSSDS